MIDPLSHNYMKELLEKLDAGQLPKPGLTIVDVYHDDWCAFNRGGRCNCQPLIEERRVLDPRRN